MMQQGGEKVKVVEASLRSLFDAGASLRTPRSLLLLIVQVMAAFLVACVWCCGVWALRKVK